MPPEGLRASEPLKQRLLRGETVIGAFVQTPHPVAAEVLGRGGFDFLCIEAEHSAMGLDTIHSLVAAVELSGAQPLVRVGGNDPVAIGASLDAGARGVVVPRVDNAAGAEAAVAAALYPPAGARGAGPGRASVYGLELGQYLRHANDDLLVAIQVETRAAVENLDEILAVGGVDVVFIGPGDLSVAYGLTDPSQRDELDALLEKLVVRITEAGRCTGIFVPAPEQAQRWLNLGVRFLICSSDLGMMATGIAAAVEALAAGSVST